ncbi:MAG: PQQ-like beta-propeller repeat protein [candidate division Zixibacteria bacterium]|nr:PQQ-like beta-propeller repeat protein [candidate division Zixibacteria bacterium]
MLKKLIIAVFVLSLVLAFSGTAISGPGNQVYDIERPTHVSQIEKPWLVPALQVPDGIELKTTTNDTHEPNVYNGQKGLDTSGCAYLDYADWGGAWYTTYFVDDGFKGSVRYDVSENHIGTLYEAYLDIREATDYINGDGSGGCGIIVEVWDDAGGAPNNLLWTENIPASDIPMDVYFYQYVEFNGGAGVDVGYGPYHVSFQVVGGDPVEDYIRFYLNQNADGTDNGRSYMFYPPSAGGPAWVPTGTAFGIPLHFTTIVYACQDFSFCYRQRPHNGRWLFPLPDDPVGGYGGGLNGFGQRFYSESAETLNTFVLYLYEGSGFGWAYGGTNEATAIDIQVVADDGFGSPDPTTVLATANIPAGMANIYPNGVGSGWNIHYIDFSAANLVFTGMWHVLVNVTTSDGIADGYIVVNLDDQASTPDPGEYMTGGSTHYIGGGPNDWVLGANDPFWMTMFWGDDFAMLYAVFMCIDEFSVCEDQYLHNFTITTGTYGPPIWVQRIKGKMINRIEQVWFYMTSNVGWGFPYADPATFDVVIYNDNSGVPGDLIYQAQLAGPGWTEGFQTAVIPNVQVVGDFYIGFAYDNTVTEYVTARDGSIPDQNGGPFYSFDGVAFNNYTANLLGDAYYCGIPFDERVCDPLVTDWPTLQQNQQRTGAGLIGIGSDAYCDLTLNNYWEHPTLGAASLSPIVYDGKVVAPFSGGTVGEYAVFDLYDISTPLYTLSGFENLNSVPSIFEIGGNPYLFVAGGAQTSITCYDFSTVPATFVWEINEGNGFRGHPMNALYGTNYTNFLLLNDGAMDVLFFTTNDGRVYAAEALTGDPYSGWDGIGNMYNWAGFSPAIARGAATDGVGTIFFGGQDAPKGRVVALDAFTGSQLWVLTGTNLKGTTVFGVTVTVEGFDGGICYDADDNSVYAISTCIGDHPVDAVLYKINASTGALTYFVGANYMRYAQTPVIDKNTLLCQTYTRWRYGNLPGDLSAITAFRKTTGNVGWVWAKGAFTTDNRFYNEMLLTCEPEVPDQIFAFSENGYLHCLDADNGVEIFNRLIDYGPTYGQNIGGGGALAIDKFGDTHLIFETFMGGLIDLTKQTPRPRLAIPNYIITKGVSFGTNPTHPVLFEDFYYNTGCVDLNVTLDVYDATNGSTAPPVAAVSNDLENEATRLASAMADNKLGMIVLQKAGLDESVDYKNLAAKAGSNPAALAAPPFVAQDQYIMPALAAGSSADFTLLVDQTQLNRGIQTCYVVFTSDDPDYFLNDPTLYGLPTQPEVTINVIGGCLIEKTDLTFGESQQWTKSVSNTGRIGNRDADAPWTPACWDIEGDDASYYAGAHFYAVDQYRVAMNSQDWLTGTTPLDGEDAIYASLQADPNYVSDDCVPALNPGVNMGKISYNGGASYTTLYGNTIHTTVLDSVQNWDPGDGWDWSHVQDFFAPFDDTLTMGLMANVITIGVYGNAYLDRTLHNCVIKVWNFTERNGNAVENWYFGTYQDPDIGGTRQRVGYYGPASLAWTYADGGNVANGVVKIPFGCGQDPVINAVHFWGNQSGDGAGFFAYVYWDSLYNYCEHYSGGIFDNVGGMSGGDGESHYTVVQHDFEPHGEFLFAEALFQLTAMSNSASPGEMIPLANMANKFMGWGRGDLNNDNVIDLRDIVYLINRVYNGGPGAYPFEYLGNMNPNEDAVYDLQDIEFLIAYYFEEGPCPDGYWKHVSPIWDATYE